jgi:uncharacterized protein
MRLAGESVLHAPVEKVWDALLDPAVLVRTIPGCERLEETGDNRYDMTVTAGVAAIRGTYAGTCELRDLRPHESLVMAVQGAGAPGTISADVAVRFEERPDGTAVSYDADAVVGGMLGGVGQRMLGSVSKRMAGEFFGAIDEALAGGLAATAPSAGGAPDADRAMPGIYVDAPRTGSRDDFLRGIAVGAGLVLLGVVAGRLGGRPR